MRLFVVRHGQTDWNLQRKIQGTTDIELNENGIRQANDLKKELQDKDFKIDLIISSPLKRARETAQIISDGKIDIIYDDNIIERNHGELEGTVISEELKEKLNELNDINSKVDYKGVENVNHLCGRIFRILG